MKKNKIKKMEIKIKRILFAVLGIASMVYFEKADAIEYGMLGGRPTNPDPGIENSASWFIYNLSPGQSKEDSMTAMNLFEEPLDVLIYAADTIRSSSGGFALKQYSEPKEKVGSWVRFYFNVPPDEFKNVFEKKDRSILSFCALTKEDLSREVGSKISDESFGNFEKWCQGSDKVEIRMEGKEKLNIPFVFKVPEGVDVGEHTGGILIQKSASENSEAVSGSAVKLTTRVGIRIYETVPGEIVKKLSFSDFSIKKNFSEFFWPWNKESRMKLGEHLVVSKIGNEGNVSTAFKENIIIKNLIFGNSKHNQQIEREFQVLKGDEFISNFSWIAPRFGYFLLQKNFSYKNGQGLEEKAESETIKVWIFPWRELGFTAGFLLILGIAYAVSRNYYKKKYGGIGWAEYKTKKTDTLAKLAEKCRVDWKVLVKTNKIKAPYLLEAGQIILVPPVLGKTEKKAAKSSKVKAEQKTSDKPIDVKEKFFSKKKHMGKVEADKKEAPISFFQKNKKAVLIGSLAIILAVAVLAIILFLSKIENSPESSADQTKPAPVPEERKEEIKAPVDEVDKAVSIKVLNQGAAPGSAGKAKDFLVAEGFSQIEAGNGKEKVSGSSVLYVDLKFKNEAEEIVKILNGNGMKADLTEGESGKEGFGNITVVLGK